MLSQRIEQFLIDRADQAYQNAPSWASALEAAVMAMAASLTNGGRLLTAGWSASLPTAQLWTHVLTHGLERDRPALPAWTLSSDGHEGSLSRQLMAHGNEDDLLVIWSLKGQDLALIKLAEVAQEKGMTVVGVAGGDGSGLIQTLQDTDVALALGLESAAAVLHAQSLIALAMCSALDLQLMGDEP